MISELRCCVSLLINQSNPIFQSNLNPSMRIRPLTDDINAEGLNYENRRRKNIITLLGVLQRRDIKPSPAEWSIIQSTLDTVVDRRSDMYGLMAMAIAFPTRHRVGSFANRAWIPALGYLYGNEYALQTREWYAASEAWRRLVMLDTPVGEVARVIYAPRRDPTTIPDSQMITTSRSVFRCCFDFMFLSYTLRSVLATTSINSPHGTIRDILHVNISTRFFTWRPIHLYAKKGDDDTSVAGGKLSFFPSFAPREYNQMKALTMVQSVIDNNTAGFAWAWYMFHLGIWRLSIS